MTRGGRRQSRAGGGGEGDGDDGLGGPFAIALPFSPPPSPLPPPPSPRRRRRPCRHQSTLSRPLPSPSCRPRRFAFVARHRWAVAGEQCRNGGVNGVGGSAVGVTVTRRAGALRGAQKLLALLGASRLVLTSRSGLMGLCDAGSAYTETLLRAVHTGRGPVLRRARHLMVRCGSTLGTTFGEARWRGGRCTAPSAPGGAERASQHQRLYCGSESRGAPRGRGLRRAELMGSATGACSRASPRPTLPRRTPVPAKPRLEDWRMEKTKKWFLSHVRAYARLPRRRRTRRALASARRRGGTTAEQARRRRRRPDRLAAARRNRFASTG